MTDAARKAEPRGEWTEERIAALIEARHPKERGEWAVFRQLRNKTGYSTPGRESYLDFFAMGCWPSGGYTRVAYEIKVSRKDFIDELRDPTKRAEGMKLSNEFWFAAPGDVIRQDEVPEGCGWLLVDGGGLKVKKQAPHRDVPPLSMSAVASILRNAQDQREDRASTRELRAFKYAGRELTVAELLKIAHEEDDKWREQDVRRRLKDELEEERARMPEVRLTKAVAEAMGRTYDPKWRHGTPDSTAFLMWVEAQRLGVPADVADMMRSARRYMEDATEQFKLAEEALRVKRAGDGDRLAV